MVDRVDGFFGKRCDDVFGPDNFVVSDDFVRRALPFADPAPGPVAGFLGGLAPVLKPYLYTLFGGVIMTV